MGFLFRPKKTSPLTPEELARQAKMGNQEAREKLLREYKPFALKLAAEVTGEFIDPSRDEASIALLALNQAIDIYSADRGVAFLTFSATIIRRRLADYYRRQGKAREIPITSLASPEGEETTDWETGPAAAFYQRQEAARERQEEVMIYRRKLAEYGIDFADLVRISPKHQDARDRALTVAYLAATTPELANKIQREKMLPLKELEEISGVPRKTLERLRKYIIAVALIEWEQLRTLREYIEPFPPKGGNRT